MDPYVTHRDQKKVFNQRLAHACFHPSVKVSCVLTAEDLTENFSYFKFYVYAKPLDCNKHHHMQHPWVIYMVLNINTERCYSLRLQPSISQIMCFNKNTRIYMETYTKAKHWSIWVISSDSVTFFPSVIYQIHIVSASVGSMASLYMCLALLQSGIFC